MGPSLFHLSVYSLRGLVGSGALLLALSLLPAQLGAQGVPAEVRKVVSQLHSLRNFRANLVFSKGERSLSGVVSYEQGKAHIRLQNGRVVATNGIYMIAYNPASRVAGKQLVAPASGGAGWLLKGFDYELSSAYQALGQARDAQASVQQVSLEWGKDHVLRRLGLLHKNSQTWFYLHLSAIRKVTSFSPSLFSYRPPTGSRTVENALNRKK